MKTALVFLTSAGNAGTEMMDGVRKFAQGTDWNIQTANGRFTILEDRESPIPCDRDA